MEKLDECMSDEELAWLGGLVGEFKDRVAEAIRRATLREREACARLAEAEGAKGVAVAIRDRSEVPGGAEKRAAPRLQACGKPVTLAPNTDEADIFSGRLIDYSDGGLGILISRQVAKGSVLLARGEGAPNDGPAAQLEVRYCISTGTGWRIGCQFRETPRRIAMTLLGLSAAQGGT
ncbi:MAG: PilZ domain-containing protein [Gemmataceae bacterium]|nr:PilZ domain-containing protein [Gemmataceae bacterium]